MTRMRIGELMRRAGVTARTVRYYESLGLMPAGEREGSGQHYYDDVAVVRLRKIEQLKLVGLSLDEIGQVIDLYFTDPSGAKAKRKVLTMLKKHLTEIDDKIAEVHELRTELHENIARFEHWLEQHD